MGPSQHFATCYVHFFSIFNWNEVNVDGKKRAEMFFCDCKGALRASLFSWFSGGLSLRVQL